MVHLVTLLEYQQTGVTRAAILLSSLVICSVFIITGGLIPRPQTQPESVSVGSLVFVKCLLFGQKVQTQHNQ